MYLREPIYLRTNNGRRVRRQSPLRQIANALFITLVIGANYLVFFHDSDVPAAPATEAPDQTESQPDAEPGPPIPAEERPSEPPGDASTDTTIVKTFKGRLKRGDTVFRALMGEGLDHSKIAPVLSAMKDVFDFRRAQVGHRYSGTIGRNGRVLSFEYQTGPLDTYQVHLEKEDYVALKKNIPVDRRMARIGCTLGTSLFASLTRCGEGPELARMFTDLFAFDVDFFQEIRRGDVVRIIVEKVYINGRFLKYDKIHAARYEGKFGTHAAFLYKDSKSREAYFAESGRALKKEFLKTPLKYTRISSGFTHRRFHPTLHRWKRHLAIDYAAPVNTPVQAVASGQVKYVGRKGASGNLVVIEHSGGYTSYYAHLNKFGRIEAGDQVSQRTVIGYVGKTGRATGPHLHFALKHGRKWVNPLTVKYTEANPVTSGERARFEIGIRPLLDALRNTPVRGLTERQG